MTIHPGEATARIVFGHCSLRSGAARWGAPPLLVSLGIAVENLLVDRVHLDLPTIARRRVVCRVQAPRVLLARAEAVHVPTPAPRVRAEGRWALLQGRATAVRLFVLFEKTLSRLNSRAHSGLALAGSWPVGLRISWLPSLPLGRALQRVALRLLSGCRLPRVDFVEAFNIAPALRLTQVGWSGGFSVVRASACSCLAASPRPVW